MSNAQFIIFELEKQQYGIRIDFVNGINKLKDFLIYNVPNSPTFIEGIINLRGKVIPLYNLRKRFNLANNNITKEDEILIAIVDDFMIGLIVNEVIDIVKISDEDIEPTNRLFSNNIYSTFISGIAKTNEHMIIILDVQKVLTAEEQDLVVPLIEGQNIEAINDKI
ncbi:chemotaxis protein CheW [Lutispora thermophila]|uniref:Purine-binding chemotaxis protein CheW n=1 Tax=Lutispora thermophila DSM 19022 TaxID=1122184 RepID=A0A1M6H7G5_9FIRM|nr:chemotaxis protein CheW [Lutispora thermophila]SHJ18137.1 purine-binding chemotaxis protein CheW [Lutispora thermophila DSM 19022]